MFYISRIHLTPYQIDDSFVIVDCGGGTVDLISYKVTKTSPMEVREVVKGEGEFQIDLTGPNQWTLPSLFEFAALRQSGRSQTNEQVPGALCGAIFVDERFKDLLKQKLKVITEDALERVGENDFREMVTENWENGIRKAFTGEAQEWTIRYPYSLIDPDQVRNGRGFPTFVINSEDIKEVFRPIMEKIQALVVQQINAVVAKEDKLPKARLPHSSTTCKRTLISLTL